MFKKTAILMVVIFGATIFSGFNFKPIAKKIAVDGFLEFVEQKIPSFLKSDDDKWIESKEGVYLWNPNPIEGESVRHGPHPLRIFAKSGKIGIAHKFRHRVPVGKIEKLFP